MMKVYNRDYFNVFRQEDGTYRVTTKSGETIAIGRSYKTDQSGTESKYISVIDKKGLCTLYDRYGKPLPHAQNVADVLWDNRTYKVRKVSEHFFKEYRLPCYKVKCLLGKMALIAGMGALGCVGVLVKGCCDKKAEYEQKTQMTYLGISNGVALFDTDGNKQTAEVVSSTSSERGMLSNHQVGRLYGCEGQTHSIAKWKEISQIYTFEKIR